MPTIKAELATLGLAAIESEDGGERVQLLVPLPEFWTYFRSSPNRIDGKPNPLDRYSKSVILPLANKLKLRAVFPSDGPPYAPFITWALTSKQVFVSPTGLLVHPEHGLWISFRGAMVGGDPVAASETQSPCQSCIAPCVKACPVVAFSNGEYDVAACQSHLASGDVDCWQGCRARATCVANSTPRDAEQSAFHMHSFMS